MSPPICHAPGADTNHNAGLPRARAIRRAITARRRLGVQQYHQALRTILEQGEVTTDRTGTGTIAYFGMRGTIFNHNTAQLWSIAAATWLLHRALRHKDLKIWAALATWLR